jgi:hypothetical protein
MWSTAAVIVHLVAWAVLVGIAVYCARRRSVRGFLLGGGLVALAALASVFAQDSFDAREWAAMALWIAVLFGLVAVVFGWLVKRGASAVRIALTTLPVFLLMPPVSIYLLIVLICVVGGRCIS